ncbi:uncharacterized protein SAPINGB_P002318 [Magnusiomyces paraingens]|uniref:Uncharacterized protein n=1 Tax=Magnusiomyces paraingens TaxID=2606893 RepID=A0A5E8BJ66_9ASCO|nr:uncharacterized protein SAPINGB_P002318 [Saprochaete ingens]VVT49537.1 unnamed protein product [Saprochaete ingens]
MSAYAKTCRYFINILSIILVLTYLIWTPIYIFHPTTTNAIAAVHVHVPPMSPEIYTRFHNATYASIIIYNNKTSPHLIPELHTLNLSSNSIPGFDLYYNFRFFSTCLNTNIKPQQRPESASIIQLILTAGLDPHSAESVISTLQLSYKSYDYSHDILLQSLHTAPAEALLMPLVLYLCVVTVLVVHQLTFPSTSQFLGTQNHNHHHNSDTSVMGSREIGVESRSHAFRRVILVALHTRGHSHQ